MWSTPLPLTDRGIKYLTELVKLPKDDAERLIFFQQYLEDADEMLARDAYDEFARRRMRSSRRSSRSSTTIRLSRGSRIRRFRRAAAGLYLVILGITGTEKDLPMIEEFMTSSDRKRSRGSMR